MTRCGSPQSRTMASRMAAENHDARNASEVLHDGRRGRRKGDSPSSSSFFIVGVAFGSHFHQGVDIDPGDVDAVFEAQQIFQEDFREKGRRFEVQRPERLEDSGFNSAPSQPRASSCLEAIRHDPSQRKK